MPPPPPPPGSPVSPAVAVSTCAGMTFMFVAILYAPTVILRLPPATSITSFLLRRFASVAVGSLVSVAATAVILGVWGTVKATMVLSVFGIRKDHLWQALIFPFLLTSLPYAGSFASRLWLMVTAYSSQFARICAQDCLSWIRQNLSNILAWRNYVVAPITEEIVFRSCMIPLLLCGGFRAYKIIFLGPIFFSLAHLHHFMDLYFQKNYTFYAALLVVGTQLGYTVIFGWYASFLYIRTGNLISPIVAHIFCNIMGLPLLSSPPTKGLASFAFVLGLVSFGWILFPITSPGLYNIRIDECSCWHGYCNWK